MGQGIYESGKYYAKKNGVWSKEYRIWDSMLTRCYSRKYQNKKPTYIGCTVSENFKNFQFFAEWCQSQIGFGNNGWVLDKDILIRGNKMYSPDTCCFVPKEINHLLKTKIRGKELPLGVYQNKRSGRYCASFHAGAYNFLGCYVCPSEAHFAYKVAKESHIKEVANTWKDLIDVRLYEVLMSWEIQ